MSTINSVEDCYRAVASELIDVGSDSKGLSLFAKSKILGNMTQTQYFSVRGKENIEIHKVPSSHNLLLASRAYIFLRDNLLQTTGQRIWGLTFTLYPDGKFNIEYDYNKPEGYEETNETISLGDALGSLQSMGVKVQGKS